jgi:dihydrofolate reductase
MRKLIVQEFVSIDGRAAGPKGSVDFIPASTTGDRGVAENQLEFIETVDTMVLGRRTYEMFAGYWPSATEEGEFGDKLNSLRKIVFSSTLDRAPWGSWPDATISRDDPGEEVARLRKQEGRDIVAWGSLSVVAALRAADLVDEYQLWLLPVVLGGGTRLFDEGSGPLDLELLGTRTADASATLLRYRPRAGGKEDT